jgi:hypothetical protein
MALAARDPARAHERLLETYCEQRFTHSDDPAAISGAYRQLLGSAFGCGGPRRSSVPRPARSRDRDQAPDRTELARQVRAMANARPSRAPPAIARVPRSGLRARSLEVRSRRATTSSASCTSPSSASSAGATLPLQLRTRRRLRAGSRGRYARLACARALNARGSAVVSAQLRRSPSGTGRRLPRRRGRGCVGARAPRPRPDAAGSHHAAAC